MNATMIKGERSKLLAVAVAIAMVACALVAFMPSADATDSETSASDVPEIVDGIIKLTSDVKYTANEAESAQGKEDVWRVTEPATLDLNGFTLSLQCLDINLTDGGTFKIIDSAGTGKIVKNDGEDSTALIQVQKGTLEMTGGSIEAVSETGGWYGVYAMSNTTVKLQNTTIMSGASAIGGNGTMTNTTIELVGVNATSTGAAAVFFPSTASLDIDGGVFTGTNGIEVRAGTVTVDGAEINATGSASNEKNESDGPLSYGMAIAVIDRAGYADGTEISVTIGSDVTLNGNTYGVYVGDVNGIDGNTGAFNIANMGAAYTFNHTIDFAMPGYSNEFTGEGYRFAAIDVSGNTFTVPAGIVIKGTVSFVEGESFTVSNVKAAGEDGLTISKGSIVLTGEMTAAEAQDQIEVAVAAGESQIKLKGLTITSGTLALDGKVSITGAVSVAEGAGLDLTDATVDTASDGSIANKGTVTGGENIPDSVTVDNEGIVITNPDSGIVEVGSYSALFNALMDSGIKEIYLTQSIEATDVLWSNHAVTVYVGSEECPDITLDMNGKNMDLENMKVIIDSGSTLVADAFIRNVGTGNIVTESGSKVDVSGATLYVNSGKDNEDMTTQKYLNVAEGALYNVGGSWFKVYHGTTTGNKEVQYGFALDIKYDGIPNAGRISGFEAATLDNYFTQTEPPTGTLMIYSDVPERDVEKIDMGDLTVDDFSKDKTCTSAGYYILEVTIPLTSTTSVQFYDYVVFEVTKATADRIIISDEIWYYGSPVVPTITYSDADEDDFSDYITALGENTDDLVFTITKDGETIKTLTYSEFVVSNLNLDVGTYTITADFPAKNANYNPVDGVTSTITVEPPKATVDVVELPPYFEGEDGTPIYDYIYGAEPKEFLLNGQYKVTEDESNDMKFYIAGTAFYIADVNAIAPDSEFPEGEDSGYFIPVAIMNNNTYEVTVTMPGNGNEITLVPGDGVVTLVYVGDLDGTTIEFPVSAVNYEEQTLVVDYSDIFAETTSGYEESAEDAKAGMTAQGQGRKDVADKTMWMVYDSKDATSITQYLFFGDAPESADDFADSSIYVETYADPASVAVWYFSFVENQPSYTQGGTVTKALTPGDYKPGMYTMVAVDQDGNIIATATEYIAGVSGSGYDENAETVFDDMTGAGVDWSKEEGWTEDSDYSDFVAPSTMWIVWYNGQEYTGDVTATVYYGGAEFFKQSYDSWKSEGLNKWYFSDDSQWGEVDKDFQPGKYTIEITVEGIEDPIAEATVYVPGAVDIGFSEDGAEAQGDMNEYDGVDISDAGESKNVMWMVWYGQGYTETVTANLYYANDLNNVIYTQNSGTIKDWLDAGIHTWYFSFDDQDLELKYGKYTMQIVVGGQIIATDDITIYGDTVNVFLNEDPVDGVEEYDRDFAWGIDTPFYLPESGNKDWTIDYWYATDANGVVHEFAPGSVADLRDIVDEDMNVEFIAHYENGTSTGTDPAVSIDMPGTAVANGGWIYFTVTTTGDYEGLVKGFATTIDGATVQYLENAGDLAGQWVGLPIGTDGRYNFGPSDGFLFTDGATSYFRVSFENAGNYQFTVSIEDGIDIVCSANAQIVVVGTSGGDEPTEPSMPFQLDMYSIAAERVDGGIHVTISVNPELLGDYYFQLSIGRITISDYSGDSADIIRKPFLSTNPGANGIVYDGVIPCDFADGEIGVFFDGWVADEWLALGPEEENGVVWIQAAPLLNDDYGGQGVAMTFEIVDAPADAPADNNYPWLQVNYERLEQVKSVTLSVDGTPVTDITWVDENGDPIEGEPVLGGGVAFFQLSIADGEITAGVHTFTITAIAADGTEDTITMTYTVEIPGSE